MKPSKQWRKSSRWRKARQRAIDAGNEWLWSKICRMERGDPLFGPRYSVQEITNSLAANEHQKAFLMSCINAMQFDALSMPRPFPRNVGATTIRWK